MTGLSPRRAAVLAMVVSFDSMAAELALAQAMTTIYGGTVARYGTVMGLYVFAMGVGAAYWARTPRAATPLTYARVEALLALAMALAVPAAFLGGHVGALTMALVIGCLAGVELPVLLDACHAEREAGGVPRVLGGDFLGSVVGATVVPAALFTTLGVVGTSGLVTALNGAASLAAAARAPRAMPALAPRTLAVVAIVLGLGAILWRDVLADWLALRAFPA